MAAQKGKDLLLKLDEAGDGSFATIAGLRARKLSFNAETVDITDTESAGRWRELLGGAGVSRASLSGSGIFKDAGSDATLRSIFFAGRIAAFEAVIPDFGRVSGPFQVTALEYAGEHNGEVTFDVALESAGALRFDGI
ncbi:phage major tail protein, TP901-1 family [Fulvimarina sp. 2208YS6-2-32]|uniref:Phage major tail protein, TP901-1 family n=1 Tax=Fulvimarina uroteuthidis TaxID=3098149 RepID=A0ABU5I164_9HYPH|nr:phage major tail protein, TP901-1 family [Fulvimarina sp. 2208YS6-2-32]MDY8109114.1 phage major tail protein, TP901-1 family [Fulvimarina sp. 2208YS6-2-32]